MSTERESTRCSNFLQKAVYLNLSFCCWRERFRVHYYIWTRITQIWYFSDATCFCWFFFSRVIQHLYKSNPVCTWICFRYFNTISTTLSALEFVSDILCKHYQHYVTFEFISLSVRNSHAPLNFAVECDIMLESIELCYNARLKPSCLRISRNFWFLCYTMIMQILQLFFGKSDKSDAI